MYADGVGVGVKRRGCVVCVERVAIGVVDMIELAVAVG